MLSLQVLRNLKRSIHVELCLAPHPNIVRLHGWSVEPNKGRVMLVMEYVGGGCLGTHISSGVAATWTLDEVLNVAQHLATGVAFLHAHTPPIVHRDIKPENVLFGKLSLVAKLADFGTSRAIDDSSMTEFAVGTMLFSSPEQLRYAQYDAAVDVWALGCVFACIARGDTSPCAAVDGCDGSVQLREHLLSGRDTPSAATPVGHCLHEYVRDCCVEAPLRPTAAVLRERLLAAMEMSRTPTPLENRRPGPSPNAEARP